MLRRGVVPAQRLQYRFNALWAWIVPVSAVVLRAAYGRSRERGEPQAAIMPLGQQAARPGWLAGHQNLYFALLTGVFATLFY